MDRFLIVADDVTGASDTGVQLVRHGYPTVVLLDGKQDASEHAVNCVVDTESRNLPPQQAYERTRQLLGSFRLQDYAVVQKKVDSTLRGNIAREVKALDEAYQSELIVFMPALPDFGRTTVQGVHYLHGTRLKDTELARDPGSPVKEDRLAPLLEAAFTEPIQCLTLEDIRAGGLHFRDGRIFCADAQTNEDMQTVIQAALHTNRKVLWVGSAAILDNLLALISPVKPALAVVASISSVARKQVARAAQEAAVVEIPVADILMGTASKDTPIRQAAELLGKGRDVLLVSDATLASEKLPQGGAFDSARAMALVGEVARAVVDAQQVSGLFLSGGDTAVRVLETMGAGSLRIEGEVLAGLPLSHVQNGPHAGLPIVTKAGAFGQEDAITYSLRKLREVASQQRAGD